MEFSLAQLADLCAGELIGDEKHRIEGVEPLSRAHSSHLSLYTHSAYRSDLLKTQAGAVLTSAKLAADVAGNKLLVNNPQLALAKILGAFDEGQTELELLRIARSARISRTASIGSQVAIGANSVIAKGAKLGDGVRIAAGVSIGENVHIGNNSRIDSNVSIYRDCLIGEGTHISAGAVIGADGFGFAETEQGGGSSVRKWVPIPQRGRVVIGDRVHIGANTTIDRGSLDATHIADGVIIDNLVQIAHNVYVGRNTAIAGCAAIAGSAHIGENCKIGGRAAIIGHLQICDETTILADSLVTKSINTKGVYSSSMPALPVAQWRRLVARLRRGENVSER